VSKNASAGVCGGFYLNLSDRYGYIETHNVYIRIYISTVGQENDFSERSLRVSWSLDEGRSMFIAPYC